MSPFITCLLTTEKGMDRVTISRFLSSRVHLSSPFSLLSVRETIREVRGTIRDNRGVAICNSCSYSNMASAILLCSFLHSVKTGISFCVPSHRARNCKLGGTTIGSLYGSNASLVMAISGNISTISRTRCVCSLNVRLIMASRREVPTRLPHTRTVIGPRERSNRLPFASFTNINITFGLIYTICNSISSVLRECTSLITVNAVNSVVPLRSRGENFIGTNLHLVGGGSHLNLTTLGHITNCNSGCINSNSITFSLYPEVGTANEVSGTVGTTSLLLYSSHSSTHFLTRRLSMGGGRHHGLRRHVRTSIGTRLRDHPRLFKNEVVIITNRNCRRNIINVITDNVARRCNGPTVILSVSRRNGTHNSTEDVRNFGVCSTVTSYTSLLSRFKNRAGTTNVDLSTSGVSRFERHVGSCTFGGCTIVPPRDVSVSFGVSPFCLSLGLTGRLHIFRPCNRNGGETIFTLTKLALANIIPVNKNGRIHLRYSGGNGGVEVVCFKMARRRFPFGSNSGVSYTIGVNIGLCGNERCLSIRTISIRGRKVSRSGCFTRGDVCRLFILNGGGSTNIFPSERVYTYICGTLQTEGGVFASRSDLCFSLSSVTCNRVVFTLSTFCRAKLTGGINNGVGLHDITRGISLTNAGIVATLGKEVNISG